MGAVKRLLTEEPQSLPAELWKDSRPTMVAEFSHFGGRYPTTEELHSHREYWVGKIVNNYLISLAKKEYELWRHIVTKKGELIHCAACKHYRIVRFCEFIEQISRHYLDLKELRYLIVPDSERTKIGNRIRQHNKRAEEGDALINHVTFPLESGQVAFLHDAPDYLGGELLPTDRSELFDLVTDWAQPPKGKRAGHGIKKWAKDGPRYKPKKCKICEGDCECDQKPKASKPKKGGGNSNRVGYIHGQGYWMIEKLITKHLDMPESGNGLKIPYGDLHISEVTDLLDKFDRDYAIEGDVDLKPPGQTKNKLEGTRVLEPAQPSFREVIL